MNFFKKNNKDGKGQSPNMNNGMKNSQGGDTYPSPNNQVNQQLSEFTQMLSDMGMAKAYTNDQIINAVKMNPGNNQEAMDALMSGACDIAMNQMQKNNS